LELKEQIEGCINNNHKCQEFLFKKYSKKLMAICVRYFNKEEDAEDALSETFIKIFKNINQFKGESVEALFFGWIKKIAINECLDRIRKDKFQFAQDTLEVHEFHLEDDSSYCSCSEKELLKMIQGLPKGFRIVFNLFAIEGYSHKEISEMIGISEGTSKSQYSRARKKLREQLKSE